MSIDIKEVDRIKERDRALNDSSYSGLPKDFRGSGREVREPSRESKNSFDRSSPEKEAMDSGKRPTSHREIK